MNKCVWCVALGLMAATTLVASATAKRTFFVEKEVRCGAGEMCYEVVSGFPLNGALRRYYPDGVVREEVRYVNGVKNGVAQKYYPDGKQKLFLIYQNGLLNGGASSYYNTGNIEFESFYQDGVLHGATKGYYEDGKIKLENEYVNGVRHGRERMYAPDGKVINEIVFDMGKPTVASCRRADGQLVNYTMEAAEYVARQATPCGFRTY